MPKEITEGVQLADRYGVSLVMLAVMVAAIAIGCSMLWLGAIRISRWARPHLEAAFAEHTGLVRTIGTQSLLQTSAMEKQARSVESLEEGHKVTHGKLDNVNERLERIELGIAARAKASETKHV